MKKSLLTIIVLICLILASCSNEADTNRTDEIKYHDDKVINTIINQYNELAEHKISKENVSNGAYSFNAKASVNGVNILIYNSSNGVSIDYEIEDKDEMAIKPIFRDFCKALNADLSDEAIEKAWADMIKFETPTTVFEIKNSNEIEVGGIKCTYYQPQELNNGLFRYRLKTTWVK